ncbi:peptide ABC transporter substrate-binding protein [Opitutaceae bacterium TAV5]|nr:peptide ABC transporter substrate-binding protein [Opitutaceae bacterium TAV5]
MCFSRKPVLLFAAGLLVTALAGCGRRETPVVAGIRTQTLHQGIRAEPTSLDPHQATQATDYHVFSALYEGLVAEDPVDLHPVPGVATRWDVSPDGLVYTFRLRADARWSNGAPVTAGDFAESIRRVLTPAFACANAPLLYVLQGAQAYHQGKLDDFSQVGVRVIDDRTLRLTLEHPAPAFVSQLNHPVWFPVHRASIEAAASPQGFADRAARWAVPGTLVGNGPFVLSEVLSGQRITVTKSPTYWDAATVKLNAISFHPIESLDAEERAFRGGQLHITDSIPVGRIDAWRRDQPESLRVDPYLAVEFYRINITRPFLNETKVRRALALAIDRATLAGQVLRGVQRPAATFTPDGIPGYAPPADAPAAFRYDPDAARKLLADAGYPDGKGAPVVEILFNTSETRRAVAETVQRMWQRELHIESRLVNQEFGATLQARTSGSYEVLRSSWTADYADPMTFLDLFTSASANNFTHWKNTAYDQLVYRAQRTADPAARAAFLREAETLLLEATPVIPLWHYAHVFLIHPAVRGWHPTVLDHHPWKHVSLSASGSPGSAP